VFKPRYRDPGLVLLSDRLAALADLPALTVCRRLVLTPQCHGALLQTQPDLIYAVLMPWITGATWFDVLAGRRPLAPAQSLHLARHLAGALAKLEQQGVAHGDLSGPNLLLPGLTLPAAPHNAVTVTMAGEQHGLSSPEITTDAFFGLSTRGIHIDNCISYLFAGPKIVSSESDISSAQRRGTTGRLFRRRHCNLLTASKSGVHPALRCVPHYQ